MLNRHLMAAFLMLGASSSWANDCRDCDGGNLDVSGTVTTSKFKHAGNGQLLDCTKLKLDTPMCMKCDFLGGEKMVSEIQLTGASKLPQSGHYSVSGTLVPGETAWYCRDVGMSVSRISPVSALPGGDAGKKNAYPVYAQGKGKLGYGEPDKVITNTGTWSHPVRKVLENAGFKVTRVELYLGGKYPVFFVSGDVDLRQLQLHKTDASNALARDILKANGQWAFEIVDQQGDRYRYNGNKAEKKSGFDIFLDDSTGF